MQTLGHYDYEWEDDLDDDLHHDDGDDYWEALSADDVLDKVDFIERAKGFGFTFEQAKSLWNHVHAYQKEYNLVYVSHDFLHSCYVHDANNLNILEKLAAKGNLEAAYAIARSYKTAMPSTASGKYWYKRRLDGYKIPGSAAEFADSYERRLKRHLTYGSLLNDLVKKRHPKSMYQYGLNCGDYDLIYQAAELGSDQARLQILSC